MSIGQIPPAPATQFQVDAYPGADTAILGSAAVTANFWNYYGTWATAYALYFGVQLEVTNYVYNPQSVERTIDQPGYWENWIATLGTGAIKPTGTPPPSPPPAPPATTDWGLVAVSGLAIASVVGLFLLMLQQSGKAATATANPVLVWQPSTGGTGWVSYGPVGAFLIRQQPNDKWAVWFGSTKYGPMNTLDEAKALAEFLHAHPHSFPRRTGKGVIYASPKRFYRTERQS